MKCKATLLILGYAAVATLRAQSWCPPGAEWYFGYSDVGWNIGVVHYQYAGDTVILGSNAQKLTGEFSGYNSMTQQTYSGGWPTLITRSTADRVDLWIDAQFDTLWYFGAVPGDSWHLPTPGWGPYQVSVVDTGTTNIDGALLRWLAVTVPAPSGMFLLNDTIIERIGSMQVFIDAQWSFWEDVLVRGLRCYHDSMVHFETGIDTTCGFVMGVDDEPYDRQPPVLSPNPVEDQLRVEGLAAGVGILELQDATGHLIFNQQTNGVSSVMDLAGVGSGIYLLRYKAEGTVTWAGRVVKK